MTIRRFALAALVVGLLVTTPGGDAVAAGSAETNRFAEATLGGGCFWCIEAVFEEVEGVHGAVSGYAGGHDKNPDYRSVCDGTTGHAEVVQVTFEPSVVSYEEILLIFFGVHDPTTLNRQGADVGTQYRSIILAHDDAQLEAAKNLVARLESDDVYERPIVTQIEPLDRFYRAEDYHQDYFRKNPGQGYCQAVIAPKLAKFRKQFSEKLAR
jgi:peptide-methionine (S)-S-oxide reductase